MARLVAMPPAGRVTIPAAARRASVDGETQFEVAIERESIVLRPRCCCRERTPGQTRPRAVGSWRRRVETPAKDGSGGYRTRAASAQEGVTAWRPTTRTHVHPPQPRPTMVSERRRRRAAVPIREMLTRVPLRGRAALAEMSIRISPITSIASGRTELGLDAGAVHFESVAAIAHRTPSAVCDRAEPLTWRKSTAAWSSSFRNARCLLGLGAGLDLPVDWKVTLEG